MARYDLGQHRRRSLRLQAYDYRQPGAYFVTICTRERVCLFADARFRTIAEQVWRHLGTRSRARRGDVFVVMPTHVHGILGITDTGSVEAQLASIPSDHRTTKHNATRDPPPETGCAAPLPAPDHLPKGVASGSLGAIVRSFKSATTRRINEIRGSPGWPVWQRNYYERVIRNEAELDNARRYIIDNPQKWPDDPNNPANIDRQVP